MDVLLINAIIYCATLLVVIIIEREINMYVTAWMLYSAIAVFGYLSVINEYHTSHDVNLGLKVSYIPYICLYISCFILTWPLKKFKPENISFAGDKIEKLRLFVIISMPIFILYTVLVVNKAIYITAIGYGDAYIANLEGEKLFQYSSPIMTYVDRISGIYYGAFYVIVILYYIFKIVNKQGSKFVSFICVFLCFIPLVASGLIRGSKGTLFFIIFDLAFYYIAFKPLFPKSVKKSFVVAVAVIAVFFLSLSSQITSERIELAGSKNTEKEVMYRYIGEAMPNLGYYFYGKDYNPQYGIRFFPELSDVDNHATNEYKIYYWSKKIGLDIRLFKTFWGDCYIEFGLVGSFIFIVFFVYIWYRFVFQKYRYVYLLPLIAYYFRNTIVYGLFSFQFSEYYIHFNFICLVIGCLIIKRLLYGKQKSKKNNYLLSRQSC